MKQNNVIRVLGVNSEVEREANDFYATDPVAIDSLIKGGGETKKPHTRASVW